MNPQPHIEDPVKLARKGSDVVVLIVTVLITISIIMWAAGGELAILTTILILILGVLLYIRLFQVTLLANSFRVQNGRHAYLNEIVNEVTTSMNVPPVDVYVTQNPVLNAFAIGYSRPFSIVLNSAVVDELTDKEIKAILIHEVGHIKYKHTIITSYLGPLATVVPVLGPIIGWVFGFWSRRAEKACDRLAVAYMKDPQTVITALIKVHVGSNIAKYMQEEGVMYQDIKGRGLMRRLAQTLPSHPFLVTRVSELIKFASSVNIPLPKNVLHYLNGGQPTE